MKESSLRLSDISRCFQGVIPTVLATSDAHGIPNVTYVSQVHLIDDEHVALSRQFFNKTSRNLDENGRAAVELYDPVSMESYRLQLRFLRTETSGELFERMSLRIDAIASMTGMAGVFRLIGADLFAVEKAERVEEFLLPPPPGEVDEPMPLDGPRNEVRGLQLVSDRINRAGDLESLFDTLLESLEGGFGFAHSMLLLLDDGERLVTVASRGYDESGVGAEVRIGEGLIGTVARERRLLRMTGLASGLSYGRAARRQTEKAGGIVAPEIPLPGLPDASSALMIPLSVGQTLVGVLAVESRSPLGFAEWHEAYLEVIGNQIALGICRMVERSREREDEAPTGFVEASSSRKPVSNGRRRFAYYGADDCIFVDDTYLIRNVPARILWTLLSKWKREGRVEFSNRELRLDPFLGLPELKDNLESRLILLRRRLQEKCPDVRLVPSGRGRFVLSIDSELEMIEK